VVTRLAKKPLLYKGKRGWFVVMYLRFTQRTNADGTTVRYAALAHNRRVEGKTRPKGSTLNNIYMS
jgi:hypothetical protein